EALAANISGVEEITDTLATTTFTTDTYSLLATQARIGYVLNNFLNLQGLVSIDIFSLSGHHYHVGETLDVGNLDTVQRDRLIRDSLANQGSVYWAGIEPNVNRNSKYHNVLVATRVIYRLDRVTYQREPVALLVINNDPAYIRKQFAGADADRSSYMILLDGNDRFVQNPDAALLGKKASRELLTMLTDPQDERRSGMIVRSSPLRAPHWRLAILLPKESIERPARSIVRASAMVMLISLVVVGVGALFFMNRVVLPLRGITERFRNLKSVPEAAQLPLVVNGGDEIANLRHGFNDLLEALHARRGAEDALRLSASVFANSHEGILITDANNTIVDVNPGFTRITGYTKEEAIGKTPKFLSSGRHETAFYAEMWASLREHDAWRGETWNRRKDGVVYAEILSISVIRNQAGAVQHYIGVFTDISQLKCHQAELENIAHFDVLTALPNRSLLADRMHQAMAQTLRRGSILAIAYLDLDGFKAINDNFGHDAGDHLLIVAADRMKHVLREVDTLARLGGDEFVAVLLDLPDIDACIPMLTRMLQAASEEVIDSGNVLRVSASLGITFYPQADEIDADQLLRHADQAMYQAKLAGKNRYHIFDMAQDRAVRGHLENQERIRAGLTGREFVLYYQPKVNMRTGQVIGMEALIRWQHPERGLLPPGAFLPVIEEHPLAVEIGDWVIDTALTQIASWRRAGLALPVSINVGARQLQQADFMQGLRTKLANNPEVPANQLELEVLETSALEDIAQVSQIIDECRALGIQFALDDFGTGYSSLTYLKRLPAHTLKIDQSFVHDMQDDPEDLAILEGVLGLATAFRRQVVAEGVETIAHGEMLLDFGCELAQGYGIARPMPASDVPAWITTWQPGKSWLNRPPRSRDDLPILFAAVEHRAWIREVETYLKQAGDVPTMDHHACRFGAWLVAEGQARYGHQENFQAIVTLHQEVHEYALLLMAMKKQGDDDEAARGLADLYPLRDALLEQLAHLA
ncbi:MAG: EAL domain-containing protein, partial [Gallionellaceae bacterium]|nr:EAL domain-containing protein [Gallionellaceae bacterium]